MLGIRQNSDKGSGGRVIGRSAGFTLVELMVTLVVLGVVMAMAFPSFTFVMNNNRLSSATNEMVASLHMARMEAIRLNGRTTLCRSEDGATCSDGAVWTQWVTLADSDRDGAIDDVVRVSTATAPVTVQVSGAIEGSSITFNAEGMARNDDGGLLVANIGVCMPTERPADNMRLVSIASGSRFSTSSIEAGGECNAPADP